MSMIPHGDPPRYLTFCGLGRAGLPHAVTTRHCPGVSTAASPAAPLDADAAAALGESGLDLGRLVWGRQVHGAGVAVAPAGGGFAGEGDVLVTVERGVALAVVTADCVPVIVYAPDVPALAVAHVGWRGTAGGAAQAAVAALRVRGAAADRLRTALGPAIGPCCYEVDAPVVEALTGAYGAEARRWVRPARPGHVLLDLMTANADLLAAAGAHPPAIEAAALCTACHPDILPSYRRGVPGRLVTVAALR
jgi:polyphenol oxidase